MAKQDPDHGDNLRYVCDMLEQLKVLASGSGGPFLLYLIDMARTEAMERLRATVERSTSGKH